MKPVSMVWRLLPLLVLCPPCQPSPCPSPSWQEAGSSCYLSSPSSLSWVAAKEFCSLQGGHLAEIGSQEEQELVTGLVGPDTYQWLGLTDRAHPGTWTWAHSHTSPHYTAWGPGQPDSSEQHCVFMWGAHGGLWADFLCQEEESSQGHPVHALCELEVNAEPALQVLWLGNSYTYYHDLPGLVTQLAAAEGWAILHRNHTEGGWTWKSHARSEVTMDLIKSRVWDVVVLQEQSVRPALPAAEVCELSLPHLATLVSAIRESSPGATLQFYLTWGRPFGSTSDCPAYPATCDFSSMQAALTASYRAFACQNPPARVAAVGEGFGLFKDSQMFLSLYKDRGEDHHPSLSGSYLAALSHFSSLYNRSALGSSFTAGLGEDTAGLLQEAAWAVWEGGQWDFPKGTDCTDCLCDCHL